MAGLPFSSTRNDPELQSHWTDASSSINSPGGLLTLYPPSPQATTSLIHASNLATTTVDSHTPLRSIDAHTKTNNSVPYAHVQLLPALPDAPPHRRPSSRRSQLRTLTPLKSTLLIAVFLPIPTLLSLVSMAAGHGILRSSHSNSRFTTVPIISSARAGAAGGAILTVPLALLLYVLPFPSQSEPDPEDFFDDNDGNGGIYDLWLTWNGAYVLCALICLCLGGAAGPLGVECLSDGIDLLSSDDAAKAGLVGGVVICTGLSLLALAVIILRFRRRKQSDD